MILELARCDKALVSLSFDSDTKVQLHTLLLGHEELFGGKLDDASKQAKEQGHHQCELKVSFKVPLMQTHSSSASAPTYTFQASGQHSSQSGRGRGKGKTKNGKGCGRGSASSGVTVTFGNPRPGISLRRPRRKVLAVVGMGMGVVHHSPREMCITSPLPQVGVTPAVLL